MESIQRLRLLDMLFVLTVYLVAVKRVEAVNCTVVTCHNGGTCNNYTPSPPCLCPLPYIAPYCTAAADYCETLQPDKGINNLPVCQNGGNCSMTYSDRFFNCSCPPPHFGPRCEFNLTEIDGSNHELNPISVHAASIAGGAAAFVVVLAIAVIFVVIWHRRKKASKSETATEETAASTKTTQGRSSTGIEQNDEQRNKTNDKAELVTQEGQDDQTLTEGNSVGPTANGNADDVNPQGQTDKESPKANGEGPTADGNADDVNYQGQTDKESPKTNGEGPTANGNTDGANHQGQTDEKLPKANGEGPTTNGNDAVTVDLGRRKNEFIF